MKTVKNILDKITSYASVFIFIMMVLMVTYQVIARYIFSAPSSVTEILTRYAFVWLIIISATYMFGQREHINIGVVKDKLPGKAKTVVNIIIECVTIAFSGLVMVFGGFRITHKLCTVRFNITHSNRYYIFNHPNMRRDYYILQHI